MSRTRYSFRPSYRSSPANVNLERPHSINTGSIAHYPTAFDVYSKPKQPINWKTDPYTDTTFSQPPKPSNLLYYFQDPNGEFDLDKMLTAAGQVADTVQQISPVVKEVGNLFNRTDYM
ncbi:YppG family protein [Lentibacillus salicampi]|uniref:Uncharacterized protein n=1 Tax=Lentibacillus salicampi TaxID=175306 RepID=A0A4Y9ACH3_9BACI|nr:YppG family protein [Lentibacillus salicampi]TFJ92071.1 hypothetical protein E4U82_14380 [Lentibacillus salicampi]